MLPSNSVNPEPIHLSLRLTLHIISLLPKDNFACLRENLVKECKIKMTLAMAINFIRVDSRQPRAQPPHQGGQATRSQHTVTLWCMAAMLYRSRIPTPITTTARSEPNSNGKTPCLGSAQQATPGSAQQATPRPASVPTPGSPAVPGTPAEERGRPLVATLRHRILTRFKGDPPRSLTPTPPDRALTPTPPERPRSEMGTRSSRYRRRSGDQELSPPLYISM